MDKNSLIKLVSAEGHEFYVHKKCAMVSGTIKVMLAGNSRRAAERSNSRKYRVEFWRNLFSTCITRFDTPIALIAYLISTLSRRFRWNFSWLPITWIAEELIIRVLCWVVKLCKALDVHFCPL